MLPRIDAVADDFLSALRDRETSRDHPTARQRFGEAYSRLVELAKQTDVQARDRILVHLRDGFSTTQSAFEFGCLANTCGQIVEIGADPAIAADPILDRLTEQLARVRDFVDVMQQHLHIEYPSRVAERDWDSLGHAHPDHAWVIGEWFALRFIGAAAMTMLCRDLDIRKSARVRVDLVQNAEAARSDNPYAYYLAETLAMVDDERLIVLDIPREMGFRVHLTAIRNNFHLFTLLQDALLSHPSASGWTGPRVRSAIVAVARGDRMVSDVSPNEWAAENAMQENGSVSDSALWTYCTASLIKPQPPNALPPWIWGEMKPTDIPQIAGERVMVLKPLQIERSWDIAFFAPLHPALRSSVTVERMLEPEEFSHIHQSLK